MDDLMLFLPEATALVAALLGLILAASDASYRMVWAISVALGAAILTAAVVSLDAFGSPFFAGVYEVDLFSQVLKVGIAGGLFLTLLCGGDLGSVRERVRTDVPFFLMVSTAGMMMLVSATELLTFYVALELSAYGLYILAALNQAQREGSESAAKYVLFGAAASAVSLFGISLVFGATRTTYMADILAIVSGLSASQTPMVAVGVLLVLASLFFKLGVFPFHAWAPDTYQGAPHQAAAFIGTVSKVAAVGVLIRVLSLVNPHVNDTHITEVLLLLCFLSMTVGNLAALVQRDLKRLLAYSTVAHAGYIMIGLLVATRTGTAAAIFYALIYVPMTFCPFLVICVLGRDGHNPTMESLRGLHRRSPFLAVILLIGMFGLAGIPPTPGFAGKWFLFAAAIWVEGHYFWLVLVAAINATISLYYYLQVVRAAYVSPKGSEGDEPVEVPLAYKVAGVVTLVAVAVLGFFPRPVWDLAAEAARILSQY